MDLTGSVLFSHAHLCNLWPQNAPFCVEMAVSYSIRGAYWKKSARPSLPAPVVKLEWQPGLGIRCLQWCRAPLRLVGCLFACAFRLQHVDRKMKIYL